MKITLPSFAKINLILRVTGKRQDGYHTLETLFQSISLFDDLTFEFSESPELVINLDLGTSDIPADQTNLIDRACRAFLKAYPFKVKIDISVVKRIPAAAGLGGGSSNAGATLVAMSRFFGWPLPLQKLYEIASELGADVPFFLCGGTALGLGKGDIIGPIDDVEPMPALLFCPKISCSTAEIYRKFDDAGLLTGRPNSIKIPSDQRPEFRRGFVSLIENDLERVVFALYPELDSIKKRLVALGAAAASLTGSGSAVFGLFENQVDRDRAALQFAGSIRTRFVGRKEYQSRLGISS